MFDFLVMVVLCRIKCRGKYSRRGLKLDDYFLSTSNFVALAYTIINKQSEVWHKRLGHPNSVVYSHLVNSGFLGNKDQFSSHLSIDCSTCKLGKSKSLSFPSHSSRAESCFDIHSDVWGITPVISHAKSKYFVTFIDDYSKYTWIYFLRSKSEVFSVFQKFVAYVKDSIFFKNQSAKI